MNSDKLTHHLTEARSLASQADEGFTNVSGTVSKTSENLHKIDDQYRFQKQSLQKSTLFIQSLKKQHQMNIIQVYGAFFFLVMVVVFIIMRRLFYRNFYNDLLTYLSTSSDL
ncbi:hypothetical protein pb186bvf_016362 [Paramecium bursaria]